MNLAQNPTEKKKSTVLSVSYTHLRAHETKANLGVVCYV